MDEGGVFVGAQSALRDDFGFGERAKFIVCCCGRDRFVVPGTLPLREVAQIQLRIVEKKLQDSEAVKRARVRIRQGTVSRRNPTSSSCCRGFRQLASTLRWPTPEQKRPAQTIRRYAATPTRLKRRQHQNCREGLMAAFERRCPCV